MFIIVIGVLGGSERVALLARDYGPEQQDRPALERLHQQDVKATLSGKADDLATLWDNAAVRIGPGLPAEVGKAAIYANDKREEAPNLCYKSEIQDLQIDGDWAFEWGYFSYKASAGTKPGRGKVLRVIRRQPDGSWKFARVMVFGEKLESAAPMSQPCE
jgi:ketosteroid isomerase-like protein